MDVTRGSHGRSELLRALGAVAVAACVLPGYAWADESVEGTETLSTRAELEGRVTAEERPFTFLVDPSTPSAGVFSIGYDVGLGSGISGERPIPVVLQSAGIANNFSIGYGVTGWLEPIANVDVHVNNGAQQTNGLLGLKVQLTDPGSPWRAALLGGARLGRRLSLGVILLVRFLSVGLRVGLALPAVPARADLNIAEEAADRLANRFPLKLLL